MTSIKKILFALFVFTGSFNLNAQITFEKTYGTTNYDEATSVRQTVDGGYIIGGTNLLKIDEFGMEEWNKPYP